MAIFQRQNSSASLSSASASKPANPAPKPKPPKPSKPSLVQRVSSSMMPQPKPRPSLIRRATVSLSEASTTRWEKRMMKKIERFPKDHPLLVKLVGAGLCVAGAGVGAISIPAVAAALGIKLAVVGGVAGVSGAAAAAGTGVALQGTAVAGALLTGAKLLASTVAINVGGRMMEANDESRIRLFGIRRRRGSSVRSGILADVPLMPSSVTTS